MHLSTIEENYKYRMKKLIQNFVSRYEELQGLDTDVLQDKLWSEDYATDFAHAVLEDMTDFSGDELFDIGR